jgi:predicted DNA-binding protein YlxM (UPF0122 family)
MAKAKLHSVDQKILERTVASAVELEFDEYDDESLNLDDLEPYLDKLPHREVDLIDMYYRLNKKQKEIAAFFSVSQGAISHRLTRAKKRLMFLRDMPKIDDELLKTSLREVFDIVDADVMFYMIRTTCQSVAANIANDRHKLQGKGKLTQVKVRHKFFKGVETLKKEAILNRDKYGLTSMLATYIKEKGAYMLHEVKLPHFDRGRKVKMNMA